MTATATRPLIKRGRTYVLLPAYNEEEGLEKLLARLDRINTAHQLSLCVLIVDDGSRDHTTLVIDSFKDALPIHVERFPENRGVSEVFRVGFRWVLTVAQDGDACITMDSDNTQNPYYILDLLREMNEGADLVIASRFAPGGAMRGAPPIRSLLSHGVAGLLRVFINLPHVRDYSTFYRGFRVELLRKVFARWGDDAIRGHGFACMARFLILAAREAHDVREVPFVLRYDLKEGGSGMRILRTIRGYLGLLVELGSWPWTRRNRS